MKSLLFTLFVIFVNMFVFGALARAEVLVAEDFLYSQPTKAFGPGGGFNDQDYGGGQNGSLGQWQGRWVSVGDGIITGTDITEEAGFNLELDTFQAATRNGLNVNWLDRNYLMQGVAADQTLYFGVSMRSRNEEAMPAARFIINDPGGEDQVSMGFFNGGFIGSLGETEEFLEGPELTDDAESHQLVGKLEINAQGNDERLTVWLDPTDVETAENAIEVSANIIGGVDDFLGLLRLDHNGAGGVVYWDDLALGTTWEDVAEVKVPRGTLLADTDSRELRISNTSGQELDLTFYRIESEGGSLTANRWNSLADQGIDGWVENNPSDNALTESNFAGSTLLADGGQLTLGRAFNRREEDLVARVGTTDGLLNLLNVEYGPILDVVGDCNGDGVVDAADLACVATIDERDTVLGLLNTLPGDLDGNGDVAFADFLVLSANFGQQGGYADGNIDLTGEIAFADFLVLSANFG